MKRYLIPSSLLVAAMIGFGFNNVASAADDKCPDDSSTTWNMEFGPGTKRLTNCIHNRGNSTPWNDEIRIIGFGPETERLSDKSTEVKVMVQINKFCRDEWNSAGDRVLKITDCDPGRAYALHNIDNMLNDYEITYGMRPGEDFKVVALVHGEGNHIVLQDGYMFDDTVKGEVIIDNPYQNDVEALMTRGVRFLFCQNSARNFMSHGDLPSYMEGEGSATAALIPGVEYITAGMTAMADLQSRGYSYIQP